MPDTIRDGSGKGYLAKVDENLRLFTNSVTEPQSDEANEDGDAYNLNTGKITLTDAVDTPVMYFKNNEDRDYIIESIAIGLGPTTGGSGGIPEVTFIRNPTTGTIIDNTTNVDINSNRNYGSNKTLTADVYKGATGNTMTDGVDHIFVYAKADARSFITIGEVLPKGTSFGIKIKPQASNTSMTVYTAIIGFIHGED